MYLHHPEMTLLHQFKKTSEKQLQEIDDLAKLMKDPDNNFDALQNLWETKKEFRLLKGALL